LRRRGIERLAILPRLAASAIRSLGDQTVTAGTAAQSPQGADERRRASGGGPIWNSRWAAFHSAGTPGAPV